ncbi:MAG: heterodisulfide reductase-related iron-sulfur binding cluster, partial [Wolinella sp.]
EPRELLRANYQIIEMSNPNQCCGFGGVTLQTERFALAEKVGSAKSEMIRESGAQVVSAECSACRMQLTNALMQANVEVDFAHPLELIADALRSAKIMRESQES